MPQPNKPSGVLRVDQLLALNLRLMQHLSEAGVVRAQLLRARNANHWPDFRSLSLLPTPADIRNN